MDFRLDDTYSLECQNEARRLFLTQDGDVVTTIYWCGDWHYFNETAWQRVWDYYIEINNRKLS